MRAKHKTLLQQKKDGELGLIIDEFGRAMWSANKEWVATNSVSEPRFTLSMMIAWGKYISFCERSTGEKA